MPQQIRLLVCGSRGWCNRSVQIQHVQRATFPGPVVEVISGACPNSPDMAAPVIANDLGVPFVPYPAQWDKYGRSAGFRRNSYMISMAHAVIAWWDGQSRGTLHTMTEAKKAGLHVTLIRLPHHVMDT